MEQDPAKALPCHVEPPPPLVIRLHRWLEIATPNNVDHRIRKLQRMGVPAYG